MEELIKQYLGEVYYDELGGGYIWGKNQNKEIQMVAEIPEVREGENVVSIRGWGAIQNMDLPCTPEDFQDAIGHFICDAINEKLNKK